MTKSFPHYAQLDTMDCGPTCLRMIAKHYGHAYTCGEGGGRGFISPTLPEKNLSYFFRYLFPYKSQFAQIILFFSKIFVFLKKID
jgi:hypothetical protein